MLEDEDEVKRGEVVVRSGRVPMRWLAIETLTHGRYSFKTDVWAYGKSECVSEVLFIGVRHDSLVVFKSSQDDSSNKGSYIASELLWHSHEAICGYLEEEIVCNLSGMSANKY